MIAGFVSRAQMERFDVLRPMIDKVVAKACHGEFSSDDVKRYIRSGKAFGGYVLDDNGKLIIGIVWEMVYYLSGMTCVNVMCVGGSKSKEMWGQFGLLLKDLWKKQGATHVECYTSPAMAKLISRIGFDANPIYVFSRGKL